MWPSAESPGKVTCGSQGTGSRCVPPISSAPAARPLEVQANLTAGQEQVFLKPFSCLLLVIFPQGNQNYITHNTPKHVILFLGSLDFKDADFFLYDIFLSEFKIYSFTHCRFQHFPGKRTEKEKDKAFLLLPLKNSLQNEFHISST